MWGEWSYGDTFLISAPDGGSVVSFTLWPPYHEESNPSIHLTGGWLAPELVWKQW